VCPFVSCQQVRAFVLQPLLVVRIPASKLQIGFQLVIGQVILRKADPGN
jgi:hypothetical protein